MTPDDIITLAKAGFTSEQIAALASVSTQSAAPATIPAPAPAPGPEQTPAPAPAAAPPAAPEPTPAAPDQTSEILRKLGVLTDAIQSSAIMQSKQPPEQTADDILAAIIRPPTMKGDNK